MLKYNKRTFEERYKELKDEFEGKEDKNKIKQENIVQFQSLTESKQETSKKETDKQLTENEKPIENKPIKSKLTKKQVKEYIQQLETIKTDFNTKMYLSKDFYKEQKLIKNSIHYLINNYTLSHKEYINKEILKFLILETKFDSKNIFTIINDIREEYKNKLNKLDNNQINTILLNKINANIDSIVKELDI